MAVPTIWTEEMVETLRRMRGAGSDVHQIAMALGISHDAVENHMARLNMPKGRKWAAEKASARTAFADRMCKVDLRRGRTRYG